MYVDNGIFLGPSDKVLTQVIHKIKDTGLDMEDQGYTSNYVGFNMHKEADGTYNFTQLTLIDTIILDIGLKGKYKTPVPAKASLHLHAFMTSPMFDYNFNNCSIVGKLKAQSSTT